MRNLLLSVLLVLLCASAQSVKASEGHYETRSQTVLVCAGHYERIYVGPSYTWNGYVIPAHYESIWCPPRYGLCEYTVFVPDYSYRRPTGFTVSGGNSWYLSVREIWSGR